MPVKKADSIDLVPPQNKEAVKSVNKWLMLPLSLLIGTAALAFFAWFIEFDYSDIAVYANDVRKEIVNFFHIDPSPEWIGNIASGIIWIAIFGIVSTAYMLPLRMTRVLRKTLDKDEEGVVALMGLIVSVIGGVLYFCIDYFIIDNRIALLLSQISKFSKTDWLQFIIGAVVVLALLYVCLWFFWYCMKELGKIFLKSIKVNGLIGGTFSALYDCFTSLLFLVGFLLVVCYGIALIACLIFVLIACSSGGRRVVYVDGEYYYVE